jgi:hypothetical protein
MGSSAEGDKLGRQGSIGELNKSDVIVDITLRVMKTPSRGA